jgi:crotonobetainyl-CoA:carnitine CoA-transferase CaiB-like acyl-CoA transferase
MKNGILQGLRVLDLTRVLAGPYATRILADFGAEVIKVQSKKTATGAESNATPYFCAWNRNKRSITLDLSHLEARKLFLELVKISDIVVENFSPRVMCNWNLNYGRLKKVNEELIMLSMSGMGQTGPWKDFVAFGPTLQSLGGLTYLTSYSREDPIGLGYAYADLVSGLYGVIAILAALEYRDKTGDGQYIDLSEYEAVCATIGPVLMKAFIHQKEILPAGNNPDHLPAAPYGCYKCLGADRWCVIAIFTEDEWHTLCGVLGNPGWVKEEKFASLPMRKDYKEELDQHIENWTVKQTAESIVQTLQQAGISAGVVQNAEDLARDPQLLARNFFVSVNHSGLGVTRTDTSPIRFLDGPKGPLKGSPLLGEANHYVYKELLGLSEDKVLSYIERGIIA